MDGNLQANLFKPSTCVSQEELRQYLSGRMTREGIRRVENHLLDCPLCADAADGYDDMGANLPTSLTDFSTFEKKILAQSGPNVGATVVSMNRGSLLLRAVAVAAVFVVGLMAYLRLSGSTIDGPALYEAYYTHYQSDIPLSSRRPDNPNLDPNFAAALLAYDEQKYSTAVSLFERTLINQPENDAARFFAGMSLLELGQADKAAGQLQPVANGKGSYAGKAAWYLVLADLQRGNLDSARARLDHQVESNGHMYRKAKELREKL